MDFAEFLKLYDEIELNQIKDQIKDIKSMVNGKNLFDVMNSRNPPKKAYIISLGLQKLYQELFSKPYFDDIDWIKDKSTLNKIFKLRPTNYEGIYGFLEIVDYLKDNDLSQYYSCLESIIN